MPRSRRSFLVTGIGLAGFVATGAERGMAAVGPDGLHIEPWFLQSFLDLRDDIETAAAGGKRLAVVVEQKGCIYCRDMHEISLADPAIADFIKSRFELLQLDMHGARMVTDTDGKELEERAFVRRARAVTTPTIIFLPTALPAEQRKSITEFEVARMPGYLPPKEFLAMFRYVAEEGYARGSFRDYLRRGA